MIQLRTMVPLAAALLAQLAQAQYALVDSFDTSSFFDNFDFFDGGDPTHGFVSYKDGGFSNDNGLAGFVSKSVYLGVAHNTAVQGTGIGSTRVSSKKTYNKGLFITDIGHMPGGCAVWPAFWTTAENSWPASGEIDIIEGVNDQTANIVTLHTSPGCTVSNAGSDPSSKTKATDCGAGGGYQGCGMDTTVPYGSALNAIGGGIFAMEWTSDHISTWFFKRDGAPADINAASPDPSKWPTPTTKFTGCDIDAHFKDHKLIWDTTFCGDWAGQVWGQSGCASLAPSCNDYVQKNPSAFADAYWLINSVKVYQQGGSKKRDEEAVEAAVETEEKRGVAFKA